MAEPEVREITEPMQDPRAVGAQPPHPEQKQAVPGTEDEMAPLADHGEHTYRGSGKLRGKVALITGGDSGIGRAVAIAYAREGADVVISYLNEHEDARETEQWVRDAGQRALSIAGDITDEATCQMLVDRTIGELGRLDILVSNAAFQASREDIAEITTEEFDRTFRTNVYATFFLCKAALPHMQPGSAILITTSIQAYKPSPTLLPYASTKGALVNFTKGLSQMVAERGIRVNSVAPGPIWTPLIPSTLPQERVQQFGQDTPLGRAGQPSELAPTFVFLASSDSTYLTGEVIGVTGGTPLS